MITDGHYRLMGLKENNISHEIENIINAAREVVIIGGYAFTNPLNSSSALNKLINCRARVKHCIFPIDLFRGRDQNRPYAMELIRNGVSVSLEPENHSKWLLSENEIYFGSANFTNRSLERRIEVVTFKNFTRTDPLKKEFIRFILQSIRRMNLASNRSRLPRTIISNDRIIARNRPRIRRFNPSIRKVTLTLESILAVQGSIKTVLANSYWLLDDTNFNELTLVASRYERILMNIQSIGNKIVYAYKNKIDYQQSLEKYNMNCDQFTDGIQGFVGMVNNVIGGVSSLPKFTAINKDILRSSQPIIKAILNQKEI